MYEWNEMLVNNKNENSIVHEMGTTAYTKVNIFMYVILDARVIFILFDMTRAKKNMRINRVRLVRCLASCDSLFYDAMFGKNEDD